MNSWNWWTCLNNRLLPVAPVGKQPVCGNPILKCAQICRRFTLDWYYKLNNFARVQFFAKKNKFYPQKAFGRISEPQVARKPRATRSDGQSFKRLAEGSGMRKRDSRCGFRQGFGATQILEKFWEVVCLRTLKGMYMNLPYGEIRVMKVWKTKPQISEWHSAFRTILRRESECKV